MNLHYGFLLALIGRLGDCKFCSRMYCRSSRTTWASTSRTAGHRNMYFATHILCWLYKCPSRQKETHEKNPIYREYRNTPGVRTGALVAGGIARGTDHNSTREVHEPTRGFAWPARMQLVFHLWRANTTPHLDWFPRKRDKCLFST